MNYIELNVKVDPLYTEILIAELADIDFESFVENEDGFSAYAQEEVFDADRVAEILNKYADQTTIEFSHDTLDKKNWNAEWESSYEPIEVEKSIRVRASFHAIDPEFTHDLLITPKMSFGTGHHETTWLVMKEQLSLPHQGAAIMDVGCGTGILAILGHKLGASKSTAFDIDEWAVENTRENFALNGITDNFEVFQGTIQNVQKENQFDGILANINRNILLAEIPTYVQHLKTGGWLIVSGFYEHDAAAIEECATANQLQLTKKNSKNEWATLVFIKQ